MLEAFATSRNLDNYENTVWLRIAPLEGTASWRSETMLQVVFLTGSPDFQYQNEKTCSANEELFYIENFVKN